MTTVVSVSNVRRDGARVSVDYTLSNSMSYSYDFDGSVWDEWRSKYDTDLDTMRAIQERFVEIMTKPM